MTFEQFMIVALITLLLFLLPAVGLYKMFEKANQPGWKGVVPFYNTWEILRLAERPKHWVFWQFIPVVGWFVTLGILVEFVKTFGKFKLHQHALTVFTGGLYLIYVGFNKKDRFVGPAVVRAHKKSAVREWIDAGVFAIVAATLIRIFIFEAYTIPTGSMEKTLLVNDFLFVSKFNYGPRIPNTPLALPFIHHTIPGTSMKSYSEAVKIPYTRWFASPVERNDVVVFNFPAGDTVINKDEFQSKDPYYDVAWRLGNGNMDIGRKVISDDPESYPLITRPVDKQENYIKRCVAIGGDTLQLIDGVLYINSKPAFLPPQMQMLYDVVTKGQQLNEEVLKEEYGFSKVEEELFPQNQPNHYVMLLTNEGKDKMIKNGLIDSIKVHKERRNDVFPRDGVRTWQVDDFGPLWVPKKGSSLKLTAENYSLYERVIRVYEGNKFESRAGKFFVNDKEVADYTFKMDYYWMMGDNRHGSQDSRFWGFVPEDHVVGEAWLIWMSWDGGVRWKRLFSRIH